MEDFIKFVIWAIIIISFFSGFFKKNKGKKTPSPPQRRPNIPDRNQSESYSNSSSTQTSGSGQNDIFKEIEKLFKNENTPPAIPVPEQEKITTKSKTAIEKSQYESTLNKEKSFEHYKDEWHKESVGEHKETASEHTLETNWDKEKKKLADARKKVSSKIEEEAKQFEKFLNQEEKFDKLAFNTIKQRLKHPQSLKEFIVISEIIGKPKALHR